MPLLLERGDFHLYFLFCKQECLLLQYFKPHTHLEGDKRTVTDSVVQGRPSVLRKIVPSGHFKASRCTIFSAVSVK